MILAVVVVILEEICMVVHTPIMVVEEAEDMAEEVEIRVGTTNIISHNLMHMVETLAVVTEDRKVKSTHVRRCTWVASLDKRVLQLMTYKSDQDVIYKSTKMFLLVKIAKLRSKGQGRVLTL